MTYKHVLYDPAKDDEQIAFRDLAKRDMKAAGTWAPGRSKSIIEQIGRTTKVIDDVDALVHEEQSYWKEYDFAINANLQVLVGIQSEMDIQAKRLEEYIDRLTTENLSLEVNGAVGEIRNAYDRIPEKWNIKSFGVAELEEAMSLLLKIQPWSLEGTISQKETQLKEEEEDRLKKAQPQVSGQTSPVSSKKSAKEKKLEKDLKWLRGDLKKVDGLQLKARQCLAKIVVFKNSVEKVIRKSAAEQYQRGRTGHVSIKSPMTRKKFYLGEIATTEGIKNSSQTKARGVLWARPWAPGVNTAFLEGGIGVGAVYKVKTNIPDNLKQMLIGGDIDSFKNAVSGKTSLAYWPFWHGIENRFTIYTDELTFLIEKGYRLHEFKRKDQSTQQLLVHPDQLDEVTAAYLGR